MSVLRPVSFLVCGALLLVALSAEAQDDDGVRERAAFASLQNASQAYDDGEYEMALIQLDAAWALFPAPAILYNRGRTLEALERPAEAIVAYEEYLESHANPHNSDGVRGAIVRLQAVVAAADAADTDVANAEVVEADVESIPPEDPVEIVGENPAEDELHQDLATPPSVRRPSAVPAWVLVGSGVAAAAAGTVFWALAKSDNDAAQGMSHLESFPEFATQERAEDRALVGNILVPLGGALVAGGVVWLIVRAAGNDAVVAQPGGFDVRF